MLRSFLWFFETFHVSRPYNRNKTVHHYYIKHPLAFHSQSAWWKPHLPSEIWFCPTHRGHHFPKYENLFHVILIRLNFLYLFLNYLTSSQCNYNPAILPSLSSASLIFFSTLTKLWARGLTSTVKSMVSTCFELIGQYCLFFLSS